MLFALDYDGTYAADPLLWDTFIISARAKGHRVFIVSARTPAEGAEITQRFGRNVDRIVFTSHEAKRRYLERVSGVQADVWIDRHPELLEGESAAPPSSDKTRARWSDSFFDRMREWLHIVPTDPVPDKAERPTQPLAAQHADEPTDPLRSARLVTVYGFKLWSESQARYRISKYKAPRDVLALYEVVLMEETEEIVPRSELDKRGRYLSPELKATEWSWRSSSFDLQSGLEVIESARVEPRV